MRTGALAADRSPNIFVFNPFAEGYIAHGKAFTPVKHQAMLAEDLANLPQFLCEPGDIVLLRRRPRAGFLDGLKQVGFAPPEFLELREGKIDPSSGLCDRKLGNFRPWAWGSDSVELLEPLFARVTDGARIAERYYHDRIARLYSKAWSADFLRKVLIHYRRLGRIPVEHWLCSEQEAAVSVDTLEGALTAIAAIRGRGHHRIVVKEALGVAGHNAIRLWEPEVLPSQHQWLTHALSQGGQLVIEPWLERELDFSVQLEMERHGLKLCGYTGLINDRKGQFLANWAEPDYRRGLPARVAALFPSRTCISDRLQDLYGEIFSLLEAELQCVGFIGPVSIDAFVYRTARGECRLKPVVEINPRYTMGRLAIELMRHVGSGSYGLFRLVNRAQACAEGSTDLSSYADSLRERQPLRLEGDPAPKIRQGALCLNDPAQAHVCLATFEVGATLALPGSLDPNRNQSSD